MKEMGGDNGGVLRRLKMGRGPPHGFAALSALVFVCCSAVTWLGSSLIGDGIFRTWKFLSFCKVQGWVAAPFCPKLVVVDFVTGVVGPSACLRLGATGWAWGLAAETSARVSDPA